MTGTTVGSYEHCNVCDRSWYSSDGYGFLTCPYCKDYSSISTRLDESGGNMQLERFPGMQYSTRPTNKLTQGSQDKQQPAKHTKSKEQAEQERKLKELNRVMSFTQQTTRVKRIQQ